MCIDVACTLASMAMTSDMVDAWPYTWFEELIELIRRAGLSRKCLTCSPPSRPDLASFQKDPQHYQCYSYCHSID